MDYAEKIVDGVIMINNGKKVIDGGLSEVKSEYGTRFIKVKYDGDAGFVSNLGYVKNVRDYGNEMEIEPVDISFKDQLLKELVEKVSVNGFHITEPSLNNIFIHKVDEGIRERQEGEAQ